MSQRITSRPAAPAATRPDIELQPTVNVNTVEALQTGCVHIVFHNDKKLAAQIINQMPPGDVYQTLVTKHPAVQSRNYLIKLNNAQKNYR